MIRITRYATLAVSSLLVVEAHSQPSSDTDSPLALEPGEYSVGFQVVEAQDDSRAVTGEIRTYPRPIRTYVWYPAASAEDAQSMRFGRYVALAGDDIWPVEIVGSFREKLRYSRRPLARSLGPQGLEVLAQRPVLAVENAKALDGPFPLIVFGQGLYYESPIAFASLAEYFAGRGFVVATTPLAGTNSPLVRVDAQDLETLVRDLEFVIGQARRFSFVSEDRLGIYGFDMGGMAGLILAMRNPDVDAFVSVDSGVLYPDPSSIPGASPHYDPLMLRIPWLSVSQPVLTIPPVDSQAEFLFETAIYSERFLLVAEGMDHVDFTSYALIEDRNAMPAYWDAGTSASSSAHGVVAEYVYNFFAAFLNDNAQSLTFLSEEPEALFPESNMMLRHHAAIPASITYDEFVQAVVDGRAVEAIEELRAQAQTEPDHMLLDETYLQRLIATLLYTWDFAEEAIPVIEFWVDLYPESSVAQLMLAEGRILVEDYPAAIAIYRKHLERNPDDERSQARLDWLLGQ